MRPRLHARRHLNADLLEALAREEMPVGELLDLGLEHLASRCPECRRRLGEYPVPRILERAGRGYEAAIARAKERVADLARERSEAPERVRDLVASRDLPKAVAILAGSPRYQTWGVAAFLLERAEAGLEGAPHEAATASLLAWAVAERLSVESYGEGIVATARSVAGAILATARVQAGGDVEGAERSLSRANDVARTASDRSLVRAELALARMAIDLVVGEWERAVRAFGQVEAQAAEGGLPGQRLRALLYLGRAHRGAGDRSRALGTFRLLAHSATGQSLYRDLGRWGALEAAATLGEIGDWGKALAAVEGLGVASFSPEEPRGRAAWEWLRGRALWRLGRPDEGAAALDRAWLALVECGSAREGAAAVLELVELRLGEGGPEAAARVLERASALYRAHGLARWAVAALFRVQRKAARGDLEVGEVVRLREELLRPAPERAETRERVH